MIGSWSTHPAVRLKSSRRANTRPTSCSASSGRCPPQKRRSSVRYSKPTLPALVSTRSSTTSTSGKFLRRAAYTGVNQLSDSYCETALIWASASTTSEATKATDAAKRAISSTRRANGFQPSRHMRRSSVWNCSIAPKAGSEPGAHGSEAPSAGHTRSPDSASAAAVDTSW